VTTSQFHFVHCIGEKAGSVWPSVPASFVRARVDERRDRLTVVSG